MQLFAIRQVAQITDVRVNLTSLVDVVRLQVPSTSTVDRTILQSILVRIGLVFLEHFWSEKRGTGLEGQIGFRKVVGGSTRSARNLANNIVLPVLSDERCVLAVGVWRPA